MATPDTGPRYNLLKEVKGYIFTDCGSEGNATFPPIAQHKKDARKVYEVLRNNPFHYDIILEGTRVTTSEVDQKIQKIAKDPTLKDKDGIILVFLMYGDHGLIYPSDSSDLDNGRNLMDLLEPLRANKCTALAGKPKIIIVQTVKPQVQTDADPSKPLTIPADADFLYLWSRLPGDIAVDMSQPEPSSLFITKLCENINDHYMDEGLCRMMTRTISDVCAEINSWERNNKITSPSHVNAVRNEEFPYFISQLREDVMLGEGE